MDIPTTKNGSNALQEIDMHTAITLIQDHHWASLILAGLVVYAGHKIVKLLKSPTEKKYVDFGGDDHDDFRMGEKMPFTGENQRNFLTMIDELFKKSQK